MKEDIKNRIEQISRGEVPDGYKKSKMGIIPKDWTPELIEDCLKRVGKAVNVDKDTLYTQIGIRSHGKGIFYKEPVTGKELGNKSVFWIEPDSFILNIVFAWEQAIGKTTQNERGMIGSHRFPMYKPLNNKVDIDFLIYYFLTKRGTDILEAASPGGAGRNKTLGQDRFMRSKVFLPSISEQQKIAKILSTQDKIIELKQNLIEQKKLQKKGLLQQFISGKIKIKNNKWNFVKLKDILIEKQDKNTSQNLLICSVAVREGVISQIEHLGRSYAANDTSNYNVVSYGDIVYTKSPTGEFPYGIIKQSFLKEDVAVSPLYGVFKPCNYSLGYILHSIFNYPVHTNNYLKPIIQKGAKNTINITNKTFLSNKLYLPTEEAEQQAIAQILSTADKEIELLQQELEQEKLKKKSLSQLLLTGIVRV